MKDAMEVNQCSLSSGSMKTISLMRPVQSTEQEGGQMELIVHRPHFARYATQMENLASFQTGTTFIQYQNMEVQ